jgi:CelD/BcsL family acetyltransferase involved in cellulose biosynthesis
MGDQGFGALTDARPLCRESSPVLRFEHATWDELLQARGRNFRQQVRRFPRKLGELGTVSYRLAADPDRLQRNLDTLFALHRARWEGAETPFLQAAAFHREFAAQALAKGWLRLWFLEVSGRLLPAARPTTSPSRPPTPPRDVGPAAGRRGPC